MEPISITFLGTSGAVPTKKRSHTAIHLSYKNENILLDCGEGTQRQFKFANLSPAKLTRMLITHWHGDHVLGIPGLFQTMKMSDYTKTLNLYGPKKTKHFISALEEIFKKRIQLDISESTGKIVDEKDFYIEAKSMSHGTPSLAYSFVIRDKLRLDKKKIKKLKLPNSPLLAKLQQGIDIIHNKNKIKAKDVTYLEKGRKVTFILDTLPNQNAIDLAKNSDLLICEATFTQHDSELTKEKHHLTAHDAATIAKKASVKQLVLTHISQRYEHNTSAILDEAKKVFNRVKIVKDLDKIEI